MNFSDGRSNLPELTNESGLTRINGARHGSRVTHPTEFAPAIEHDRFMGSMMPTHFPGLALTDRPVSAS